jgi:hypothetical protein
VTALGNWGARRPTRRGAVHGSDSVVLALKSRFDPDAAAGLRGRYELRLGDDRYRIEISEDGITARRGEFAAPDAVIETDTDTLGAMLLGDRPLGDVEIAGDRDLATRFLALYAPA